QSAKFFDRTAAERRLQRAAVHLQLLELKLVEGQISVGLQARQEIASDKLAHLGQQPLLVLAGALVDRNRQALGDVDDAPRYRDLVMEESELRSLELRQPRHDRLRQPGEHRSDVERKRDSRGDFLRVRVAAQQCDAALYDFRGYQTAQVVDDQTQAEK